MFRTSFVILILSAAWLEKDPKKETGPRLHPLSQTLPCFIFFRLQPVLSQGGLTEKSHFQMR